MVDLQIIHHGTWTCARPSHLLPRACWEERAGARAGARAQAPPPGRYWSETRVRPGEPAARGCGGARSLRRLDADWPVLKWGGARMFKLPALGHRSAPGPPPRVSGEGESGEENDFKGPEAHSFFPERGDKQQ